MKNAILKLRVVRINPQSHAVNIVSIIIRRIRDEEMTDSTKAGAISKGIMSRDGLMVLAGIQRIRM